MPISDLLAQIAGEKQTSVSVPSPVQKRKADGDLQRTTDKLVRRDEPALSSSTTILKSKKPAHNVSTAVNARSAVAASAIEKVNPPISSNGTGTVKGSTVDSTKPPKKGSYAEILARAKAAQATLGKVGKIQHKPIEKSLSKRERQDLKEQGSQLHKLSRKPSQHGLRTHARGGQNGVREKNGKTSSKVKTPAAPERKVKKAALATTGYIGTARPNPAAAKSTKSMISSRVAGQPGYGRAFSSHQDSYAGEDDDGEDVEDEDEDEEDYGSDVSSDMEADVFEVDEEEEKAARIARKEDEEALREEARHQREKEAKRRRLAEIARGRR